MRITLSIPVFLILYLISCDGKKSISNGEPVNKAQVQSVDTTTAIQIGTVNLGLFIGGSEGIVSFNNTGQYNTRGTGFIYNSDGSIYAKISFSKGTLEVASTKIDLFEVNSENLDKKISGFNPKEFYPEIGAIIQFVCTNQTSDHFEVIVDKDKSIRKLIKRDSEVFGFQTWEEHLFTGFIGFDKKANPLRKDPYDTSESIHLVKEYAFNVVEIKDDWIKLICDTVCLPCKEDESIEGWVQWKMGNYMIIKMYYVC